MLDNHSTSKVCTHMTSLNKNTVTQYLTMNLITGCSHQQHSYPTLCLCCGKIYCGLYSGNQCLTNHQTKQDHFMGVSLKTFMIFCTKCNDDLQSMIFGYTESEQTVQYTRCVRFIGYIRQLWMKCQQIHKGINEIGLNKVLKLKNLGNTCFLNVTLQLLMASQSLMEFYRGFLFEKGSVKPYKLLHKEIEMFYTDILQQKESQKWHIVGAKNNKKNTIHKTPIKDCRLNICIRQLAQTINQENSFFPQQILNTISQYQSKYADHQEQDADELLNFMIDWLSQGQLSSIHHNNQKYNKVEGILGKQKISVIQNMFGSYLGSRLICKQCNKTTWTLGLTYQLAVEAKSKTTSTSNDEGPIKLDYWGSLKYPKGQEVDNLVRGFFSEEILTKATNYYSCQSCSSLTATKKLYLVSPPSFLIVTIKRFNKGKKNKDYVEFPQKLDMSGVSLDRSQLLYEVYGVVIHHGDSVHSGHYVCYVKSGDQWIWCSDQKIRKVTWQQVKIQQAYIVAYKKIKQTQY